MTTETEIKRYIENYFHPYYDIKLKPDDIPLTEPINCIIPTDFQEITYNTFTHNKEENTETVTAILNRYDDTDIEKEYKCLCTRVIDGDTIEVKILEKLSKNAIVYDDAETMTIRLVGVNTPEKDTNGFGTSTGFTRKLCENRTVYLNVDNKTPMDKYGRILAVVIVEDKNLNQMLLKEGLAEIMFLPPSEFYPFDWDSTAYVSRMNVEQVPLGAVAQYLNNEFNNICFTNQNDYNIIHRFEIYKGIIYLRLYPYNSQIRLHVLPKSYKGDSNLLIFKDEFVTEQNITKSECSTKPIPPINSTFTGNGNTSSYEMNYDISQATQGFTTLQINVGYKYPNTLTKVFHLTGIKDETNEVLEDRCTLLDANYDGYSSPTNNITQFLISSNTIVPPNKSNLNIKKSSDSMNNDHLSGNMFHKIIKYMNDDMYIEEPMGIGAKHLRYEWGGE